MQSARLYKYKCHGLHNKASQSESYSDTSHNGCSSVHLFKATRVEPGVSRRDQTKSLRVEYLSGCTTAVPVECPPDTPRVKKKGYGLRSRHGLPRRLRHHVGLCTLRKRTSSSCTPVSIPGHRRPPNCVPASGHFSRWTGLKHLHRTVLRLTFTARSCSLCLVPSVHGLQMSLDPRCRKLSSCFQSKHLRPNWPSHCWQV